MEFESILAWKALPEREFRENVVIDGHRSSASRTRLVIVVRGAPLFKTAVQTLASYTREASAARSRCCAESPQTEYVDSGGEKCNPLGTQM